MKKNTTRFEDRKSEREAAIAGATGSEKNRCVREPTPQQLQQQQRRQK